MKKIISILIISLFFLPLTNISYAKQIKITSKKELEKSERQVSRDEVFNFFWSYFNDKIPSTYEYIEIKFIDIKRGTNIYESLQKLVYLDLIKNIERNIKPNKKLNLYHFFKLSENIFWLNLLEDGDKKKLSTKFTTVKDLENVESILNFKSSDFSFSSWDKNINQKKKIFLDVYKTILESHYDNENIKEEDIIYSAIQWLADWTWDKYTTYFPPSDNKDFIESLNWNYEWIWAYVDMEKPWEVIIVSPIVWWPAEKAWIMWWDIVIWVNWVKIKKDNSLKEVISWIKWPSWTDVELEVKRWEKIINIKVTRAKIIINDIEYKLMTKDAFYLQIKSFWPNVSEEFKKSLENLKGRKSVKKIIIDLRNNPWWYLEQVIDMLSYFVSEWEPTAVVKYKWSSTNYSSKGYDLIDFSKYKIIIIQNSGSASASEIMIWTIKDYYPNSELIWTKTYWKWSVQTIKPYLDGSTLKYTVAKWFTWKTETWIDEVWIEPTIKLELDIEKFKEDGSDNQLNKALMIK